MRRIATRFSDVTIPALLVILPASAAVRGEESTDSLPRYRFIPGQELVYRLTSMQEERLPRDGEKEQPPERQRESAQEWRVFVVRRNEDSSWRLVIWKSQKDTRFMDEDYSPSWIRRVELFVEGKEPIKPAAPYVTFSNVLMGYCDIYPDGRYEMNESLGEHAMFEAQPEELFCQLPSDDALLERGWKYHAPASRAEFELKSKKLGTSDLEFRGRRVEEQDALYAVTRELSYEFDQERGIIDRVKDDWKVDTGEFRRQSTIEFVSTSTHDAEQMEALDAETMAHREAVAQWYELTGKANEARTLADCLTSLAQAHRALSDGRANSTMAEVLAAYDADLSQHKGELTRSAHGAIERQLLYAKPPMDWETTDLNDNPHRSADYRGKVVIMDFWYRGCIHCIHAMPKIKRLAAKYKDQSVCVLGINSDQKKEDAQKVIHMLELDYPVLRCGDVGKQYGVRGWPTFVVLDQSGRVALRLMGNSENLEQTVSGVVDELLANSPE